MSEGIVTPMFTRFYHKSAGLQFVVTIPNFKPTALSLLKDTKGLRFNQILASKLAQFCTLLEQNKDILNAENHNRDFGRPCPILGECPVRRVTIHKCKTGKEVF